MLYAFFWVIQLLTYEDGTKYTEMLAFKLQTPVNNPEESIQQ
jgi:hypothetical protein